MKLVSRAVIIIKAQKPYLDWANNLDDDFSFTLEELHADPTAFLVPEIEEDEDEVRILKRYYSDIFEHELLAWSHDQAEWPKLRDFEMFKDWFEISFHSMIIDLLSGPIECEEL